MPMTSELVKLKDGAWFSNRAMMGFVYFVANFSDKSLPLDELYAGQLEYGVKVSAVGNQT